MTKNSITYYTLQCEVWLDITAGALKAGSSAERARVKGKVRLFKVVA